MGTETADSPRFDSPTEYEVFDVLASDAPTTTSDVSDQFSISTSAIRRRLHHLADEDAVEQVDETPRGAHVWAPTDPHPRDGAATAPAETAPAESPAGVLSDAERTFLTSGDPGDSTPARRLDDVRTTLLDRCLRTPVGEPPYAAGFDHDDIALLTDFLGIDASPDEVTVEQLSNRLDTYAKELATHFEFLYDDDPAPPSAMQIIREQLVLDFEEVAAEVDQRIETSFSARTLSRFENGVTELSETEMDALIEVYRREYVDQEKNTVGVGEGGELAYEV